MISKLILSIVSRAVGALADIPVPALITRPVLEGLSALFSINTAEAEKPLLSYGSFGELFARKLKPGARKIEQGVVSPIDGTLKCSGVVTKDTILSIKGETLSIAELIGDSVQAAQFDGGSFYHFYLAPHNYHGVHIPCDAQITSYNYIPGAFWPVNALGEKLVPKLFLANERVAISFDGPGGKYVLVMVAALNVGKMVLEFAGETNKRLTTPGVKKLAQPVSVKKADRIGCFYLGSSVALITPRGAHPSGEQFKRALGAVMVGERLE